MLAAALLLTWATACGASHGDKAAAESPLFAASAVFPGLDGRDVALASYRGAPLIVNFWARWCVPCRAELPELAALQAKYGARGLKVLGIALEDAANADKVREFLVAYEAANIPSLLAGGKGIDFIRALGNEQALLPFTLVIGRDGEILLRKIGRFEQRDFLAIKAKLLP
jgi:thiol-disulfide isomerase/thioredoxin